MMRNNRPAPAIQRRNAPVIERASQQSMAGSKLLRNLGIAGVAIAGFLFLQDGPFDLVPGIQKQFDNLTGLFSVTDTAKPPQVAMPAPGRSEPPRVEAPRIAPPVSAPPPVTIPTPSPVPAPQATRPPPWAPQASAPPAAQPAPAAAASLLFARPPGAQPAVAPFADADVTQVVTKQVRRFNESRDVTEKQDATRQILAAATIGHPLARSIIVSAYRSSTLVQGIARQGDVVRFALDFAVLRQGKSAASRTFAALAADIAGRDPAGFGNAVLDALRDDARLRDGPALRTMIEAVDSHQTICAALAAAARHGNPGCDVGIVATLSAQASARGPAGVEEASYRAAERAFARYLQDAL